MEAAGYPTNRYAEDAQQGQKQAVQPDTIPILVEQITKMSFSLKEVTYLIADRVGGTQPSLSKESAKEDDSILGSLKGIREILRDTMRNADRAKTPLGL